MIFYQDTEGQDLLPQERVDTTFYDILSETKYLHELNIKDFNFYLFEGDLEKLNDLEFEKFFNDIINPFLDEINENYLDIDVSIFNQWGDYEKKLFMKKFVLFFMQILPYEILKPIIKNLVFEDLDITIVQDELIESNTDLETITALNNIFNYDNPKIKNIRPLVINTINKKIKKLENFNSIIDEISEISKKNTVEDVKDSVDEHVQNQIKQYNIYINIIENTDLEKLVNLFRKYIKADYLNIIG